MADVANYTDEQLRSSLKEYGVNPGPVTSSTRLFYEKKLLKLMDSAGYPQPPTESEEEEEEEEDEEVQINYRTAPRTNTAPPKPVYQARPTEVPHTPIIQKRKASPTRAEQARPTTGARPKSAAASSSQRSGGGVGMWLKLLFIILVAGLIYLVIINMNPSAENKIPLNFDEDEV